MRWRSAPRPSGRRLRAWLASDGSLSRRLDAAFGGFRVEVVAQGVAPITADEWRALGRPASRRMHVREVVLHAGGQPLVVARSVLPAVHAGMAWRAVRGLGTRPLAQLLFAPKPVGPHAVRRHALGPVRQALSLHVDEALGRAPARRAVWGRRALFVRAGVPLLLTEWFLPAVGRRSPA
ncbi:chorismate--pyruvate lyase family protein [Caldimonas sp. KR1-144]|uniref:chorismate--pyruvate lyase family protein n=1 Tax=Caldimonas sp. KR1-144 TaxID=3400911 RepID=UPI003BFDC1C4